MDALVFVILAIVVIAVTTAVAPKLGLAGPLLLVLIGIGVGLLPFVPPVEVQPDVILVGVLPPLLYSAAVALPAVEFRRDFGPIAGLSVLLVIVSSVILGFFFTAVIPGLDLFVGIALGAILSPTDAVATSIVRRLGISRRVVTLLEGESLLNDATALVLLRTMVAAAALAAAGSTGDDAVGFGFVPDFLWGVLVAVVVGGVVGYLNLRLRALMSHSAANTAIGFVVPFVAYLPTERLGGSGLVAAVVAGIVTGQGAARWFSPEQRLSDVLNWRTVELVLEGAVFLLMGLELREIVTQNLETHRGIGAGLAIALGALAIILVVRGGYVALLVWLQSRRARTKRRRRLEAISDQMDQMAAGGARAPGADRRPRRQGGDRRWERRIASMQARVSRALNDLDYYQASPLGWKHGAVIVWAGMRGVVTLAAAQTLPRTTTERALLVFIAFVVAVGSLMLQGFSLPWLVRALRFERATDDLLDQAEQASLGDELREAAVGALSRSDLVRRDGTPFSPEFIDRVGHRLTQAPDESMASVTQDLLELRLALIEVQRERLNKVSSGGQFSTAALRHALAELDADQLSLQLRLDDQS